jgi:hypothetical protein
MKHAVQREEPLQSASDNSDREAGQRRKVMERTWLAH